MCLGDGVWCGSITGLSIPGEQTRMPPRTLGQNYVEQALCDRFLELGGRLYRAARFVGYAETPDGVEVEVERSAYVRPPMMLAEMPARLRAVERTTLRGRYLIGCDGKRSAVRGAMNASYEGHDYPQTFLLADVEVPEEQVERLGFHEHGISLVVDARAGSFLVLVHLQETRWRTLFAQTGLTEENLTPEFIKAKWQEQMPPPGPFEPTEFKDLAFFEVSCKLTSAFRKGSVFLAGDAAHCHSPAGAQGMNTGLQDSANLAWKLASVVKGHAPDSLLDSYASERRPIAEWVLSNSDVAFQALTTQHSACFNLVRRVVLNTLLFCAPSDSLPPMFLKRKLFGLGISYAKDGTCRNTGEKPRGTLRAGDRLPDCRCVEAGAPNAIVYMLQLLNTPPHTTLRLLLVAETSRLQPSLAEIEGVLAAFRPLGVPLQPVLYTFSTPPRWGGADPASAKRQGLSLPGFEEMRELAPANPSAHKEKHCAELCARLRLGRGGRAILVVRPDSYIAVSHVGNWNAQSAVKALEELNLCVKEPGTSATGTRSRI
eukprot:NODE_2750_length_2152_cov_7.851852.p1 GENE.NODE_2750_length_2152_cov_7.851852~~NODE_2750_length_2152_cov_7.851852.p1  ORF type:complete len:543 (+),score=141.99 NODE_2750_length_2152_cov_7.851852:214-1842(+)